MTDAFQILLSECIKHLINALGFAPKEQRRDFPEASREKPQCIKGRVNRVLLVYFRFFLLLL